MQQQQQLCATCCPRQHCRAGRSVSAFLGLEVCLCFFASFVCCLWRFVLGRVLARLGFLSVEDLAVLSGGGWAGRREKGANYRCHFFLACFCVFRGNPHSARVRVEIVSNLFTPFGPDPFFLFFFFYKSSCSSSSSSCRCRVSSSLVTSVFFW